MKSVILSAVLLITLTVFCLFVKTHTVERVDTLYRLTESLPTDLTRYESAPQRYRSTADAIGDDWSDAVGYFSYVCGYNALNRADEAVWNLYAALESGDYPSAIAARYQLLDALRRMRELETVSFSSIF